MEINYSLMPQDIIALQDTLLPTLREVGVNRIWTTDSLTGRTVADDATFSASKAILDQQGFDSSGFGSVVVGHPGNSLNPDDPTLDLTVPANWRYRVDRHGKPVYFCADIEPNMMADNTAAVRRMRKLGYTTFSADDDLRMGNWGDAIQGCFCDKCLADFNQRVGFTYSRREIAQAIEQLDDRTLLEAWVAYNCSKVERLMDALADEIDHIGLMVMHMGDERHGLNLPKLRAQHPDMFFRVGEMYFSDADYGTIAGKIDLLAGISQHLTAVGRRRSYSETTIFPPRALSPEHWVHKARLTLAAGTENLFFMGGTWIIEDRYWHAMAAAMPGLRRIEALSKPKHRYPIHMVSGTDGTRGETIHPPALPLRAGLPVLSVRGSVIPKGGEILLALGSYDLTGPWEAALGNYRAIICDQDALAANPQLAERATVVLNASLRESGTSHLELLRSHLARLEPNYPRISAGQDLALFWVGERVLILNLLPEPNRGVLTYGASRVPIELGALAIGTVSLDGQSAGSCEVIQ
ncbi:MAG: hypothetical protein GXY52_06535 [Chloroflexi bacterium]|nr:hypothetical protein [Chloroflexota bacterium]